MADDRHGAHLEVAVTAGPGPHSAVPLEDVVLTPGFPPGVLGSLVFLGMHDAQPGVGQVFLQALAGDGTPLWGVLDGDSGGRGNPHHLRLRGCHVSSRAPPADLIVNDVSGGSAPIGLLGLQLTQKSLHLLNTIFSLEGSAAGECQLLGQAIDFFEVLSAVVVPRDPKPISLAEHSLEGVSALIQLLFQVLGIAFRLLPARDRDVQFIRRLPEAVFVGMRHLESRQLEVGQVFADFLCH